MFSVVVSTDPLDVRDISYRRYGPWGYRVLLVGSMGESQLGYVFKPVAPFDGWSVVTEDPDDWNVEGFKTRYQATCHLLRAREIGGWTYRRWRVAGLSVKMP